MGAILNAIGNLATPVIKGTKFALGSAPSRMLLGAAAGAGVGYATSDSNVGSNIFRDATLGAGLGLGAGFLTSKTGLKMLASGSGSALGLGGRAHRAGAGGALRSVEFGLKHPYATTAMAMGGLGILGLASTGPGSSNLSLKQMSDVAASQNVNSTGFDPGMGSDTHQAARNMFMNSAEGLVFGLHQGRHR